MKASLLYVILFICIAFIHNRLKLLYYNNCASNILYYYFFKDANLCILLNSYIGLIENLSCNVFANYHSILFKVANITFHYMANVINI